MWPWEHLAVGYLCFSAYAHLRTGEPPDGVAALTVAFATQLPDLVDKPLAWTFAIVPGGYSVAHSVFVAVPVSILVVALARRGGRPAVGAAFAIGYLSHLPADLGYLYAKNGFLTPRIVLWPFAAPIPSSAEGGLIEHFASFVHGYVALVQSGQLVGLLVLEILLLTFTLGVWIHDGSPGVRTIGRALGRTVGWTGRSG